MAAFHAKPERLRDASASGTARDDKDRYETPSEVTDAIIDWQGWRFDGYGVVDPCCGTGRILERLRSQWGPAAYGTDLEEDGVDFLTGYGPLVGQGCITNPPFKHAEAFVRHALEVFDGPVSMLLPADFMWSEGRRDWLDGDGRPCHQLIIPWRIRFFRRDGTRISGQAYSHMWLTWPERKYRPARSCETSWARVPSREVRSA